MVMEKALLRFHLFARIAYESRGGSDYVVSFETLEDAVNGFQNKYLAEYDGAEILETLPDGSLKVVAEYGTFRDGDRWNFY